MRRGGRPRTLVTMPAAPEPRGPYAPRLAALAKRARRRSARRTSEEDLRLLVRLFRATATELARCETRGDLAGAERAREALALARGVLERREPRPLREHLLRAVELLARGAPRTLRREWRTLALSAALFAATALVSYAAVARDLGLAYGLLDPAAVEQELAQLEATAPGEPFRGNFTFGISESSWMAGLLLAHNITVACLFFAAGLVPPLFLALMVKNGLMVGTYTAVAHHYGQAGAISSLLWCHGALELPAIVIAGAAGLRLVRPVVAPGPWTRRHALKLAAADALRMFAPVPGILVVAGWIEGWVTPHAPTPVRLLVALAGGAALLGWLLLAGRTPGRPATPLGEPAPSPSVPGTAVRRSPAW